jgi:hypothetical protein
MWWRVNKRFPAEEILGEEGRKISSSVTKPFFVMTGDEIIHCRYCSLIDFFKALKSI